MPSRRHEPLNLRGLDNEIVALRPDWPAHDRPSSDLGPGVEWAGGAFFRSEAGIYRRGRECDVRRLESAGDTAQRRARYPALRRRLGGRAGHGVSRVRRRRSSENCCRRKRRTHRGWRPKPQSRASTRALTIGSTTRSDSASDAPSRASCSTPTARARCAAGEAVSRAVMGRDDHGCVPAIPSQPPRSCRGSRRYAGGPTALR